LVVILLAVALACQAAAGVTIYVDDNATGLNDGSSWENAYPDLQDALAVAAYNDDIRVGQGTYKPTSSSDRTISFQLVNGVTLRGGYAAVGTANPDARDVILYETILSGDIGTISVTTDNSYNVIDCSGSDSTSMLIGFTFKNTRNDWLNAL